MADPTLLTYYGGPILGSLLLLAVLVVYVLNRKAEIGSVMIMLIGICLLGLPVWKTLDVNPKQGQFHVELRVREQISSSDSLSNLRSSVVTAVRYKVAVVNESTLEDKDIQPVVAALQRQVNEHLSPVWGVSADLTFIPKGTEPPRDTWKFLFLDDSDLPGTLGYHDLSKDGLPIGKVFIKTSDHAKASWSVQASHELLNMLVDPRTNLTVFISSNDSGGTLYAQEIASPCEADEDGYVIDGIRVSDFVYPSWFEPNANSNVTQLDYTKHIKNPFEICRLGFVNVYEVKGGEWQTKMNLK